jgi:hypothetical protein
MQTIHPSYAWLSADLASSIISVGNRFAWRHLTFSGVCSTLRDARDIVDHYRAPWLDAQRSGVSA